MGRVSANTPDEQLAMTKLKGGMSGLTKQDRGGKTPSEVGVEKCETPKLKGVDKMNTRGGGKGAPDVKGSSTKFKDTRG